MANFPKISFKNPEGWIPSSDVDGVDADSKYFSNIHGFRVYNGYIENNIGIENITLPSNVSSSISSGYTLMSSCDFTHSVQGEKTLYVLWKSTAEDISRLKLYIDNEYITLGDGEQFSYIDAPNNINYNFVNDELKINLNCNATAFNKNVILNLSLQYLDEVVYNLANNIKRNAGWYICPRWLGWMDDINSESMIGSSEVEIESFESNQPNNWKHLKGLGSLVGWTVQYGTNVYNGDYCLTTDEPDSYIKFIKMYGNNKIRFWAKTASDGDGAILIFRHTNGDFIQSVTLTDSYGQYEVYIPMRQNFTGEVEMVAFLYPGPFGGTPYTMSRVYVDYIEFYYNDENIPVEDETDVQSIVVKKYFDGQRSLMESSKFSISTEKSDNQLRVYDETIDWRVESYEIYQKVDNIFIMFAEIEVDNNWNISSNYVHVSYRGKDSGISLDFRYNLPYNSRVDNQSLIYSEVSHKGRVYFVKNDFKVYQSHIAGNGVLQPDSFPYDEEQGFGYFVVSRSRTNVAIAVSPTNDLVVLTNMGLYVYFIEPSGSGVYRYLRMVSGSVGISSRKSLAINNEGNPSTQGLMWCDNNGIYYYSGGVTEPTNVLLPAHVRYWRQKSNTHKASAIGYYDATRYEYILYTQDELITFSLPYKSFIRSDFSAISEVVGYKDNVLRFRNGNTLYKFVDSVYVDGYIETHYSSGIRDDRYGRTYDADEIDDKVMCEFYIIFGSLTDKSLEMTATIYIDDNISVGSYKVFATDIYWKRLLPIRRFRKVKIKLQVTNSKRCVVNDMGISLIYDGMEAIGVSS